MGHSHHPSPGQETHHGTGGAKTVGAGGGEGHCRVMSSGCGETAAVIIATHVRLHTNTGEASVAHAF